MFSLSILAEDHPDAETNAAIHYFRKPYSLEEFMHLGVIIRAALDLWIKLYPNKILSW